MKLISRSHCNLGDLLCSDATVREAAISLISALLLGNHQPCRDHLKLREEDEGSHAHFVFFNSLRLADELSQGG
jgi:hypothetical protein